MPHLTMPHSADKSHALQVPSNLHPLNKSCLGPEIGRIAMPKSGPELGGLCEALGSVDLGASRSDIDVGAKYRILVTGRQRTGKSTVVRRICNLAPEVSECFRRSVSLSPLWATMNDVDREISHSSFIFHDSAGFEGLNGGQVNIVKQFIARREATSRISARLHAIWYFIRTDTNDYVSSGDRHFFSDNIANYVPVIVVFTVYNGLLTVAFGQLRKQLSIVESRIKKFEKAQELLESRFIEPLKAMRYPPAAFVRIDGDLLEETTSFDELIQTTLRALSGQALRPIVLSVRQTNFDACVTRILDEALEARDPSSLVSAILSGVPHVWLIHLDQEEIIETRSSTNDSEDYTLLGRNVDIATAALCKFLHTPTPWTNTKRADAAAAICICLEQTAIQASANGPNFPAAFSDAMKAYYASDAPLRVSVNKEISKFSPQDYREPTKRAAAKLAEVIKTHRLRFADD
ncbi:hypothetical protein MKEN_00847900 [Mycena kentingensis (nom. inval.)]|nr:hypothetical protein MKEN_00847900 [Mycena kentingensis (nom. inval.)]